MEGHPLCGGKVAVFQCPGSVDSWRVQGDAVGALVIRFRLLRSTILAVQNGDLDVGDAADASFGHGAADFVGLRVEHASAEQKKCAEFHGCILSRILDRNGPAHLATAFLHG